MLKQLSQISVATRFSILTFAVLLLALALYIPYSMQRQNEFTQQAVLNEARTLNDEMNAAWDYVGSVQDRINYNGTGGYDFKGVYCAVAAKAIARNFMDRTDYTIRYVRENPRIKTDAPDEFETQALELFATGTQNEYHLQSEYEGKPAFRYVSVLRAKKSCLTCHGNPAGEKDVTNYFKEGMRLGDVAGAASIVIPMEAYEAEAQKSLWENISFFMALTIALVVILNVTFRLHIARPLRAFERAFEHIAQGRWKEVDKELTHHKGREMNSLAESVGAMAEKLGNIQASLEKSVAEQTASLSAANTELEKRQAELDKAYQALSQTNEQLEEAVRYKSDFLSIASHELKTPIASMTASLRVWERALAGEHCANKSENSSLAQANETLSTEISRNCMQLLELVNNILDAARLEEGRLEINSAPMDIVDFLNSIEHAAKPIAESSSVAFSCNASSAMPIVLCDENILHRIVDNLVINALKFTPEGGTIDVFASFNEAKSEMSLTVQDNGIGISPEDQKRIFQRFSQVDSSPSRLHGGSGLGLSVAWDMAQALGGSISLQSAIGKGSAFTLTIPMEQAAQNDEQE